MKVLDFHIYKYNVEQHTQISQLCLRERGLDYVKWICLVQDRFHKMWGISGPAENLLASQEMYFTDSDREECMLIIYSTDNTEH
jgi:hypothetical protein